MTTPSLRYMFDVDLTPEEKTHIQTVLTQAFETGEIISCPCPEIDVWAYPTHKPDFQASLSCTCDAMRPLFSSNPDKDHE